MDNRRKQGFSSRKGGEKPKGEMAVSGSCRKMRKRKLQMRKSDTQNRKT